jgi:23S rRNA pseudouridine1911/1915/1917 synthase
MAGLCVLFEDNHCLAVAKPAPLLTQAPAGVPSLEELAREYIRQRYQKPGRIYLGVPHRLDRPVSGVVLFTKSSKAARRLSEQFQAHTVIKRYWAILEGTPQPAEGEWDDWIRKVEGEPRAEAVTPADTGAHRARLHYRMLQDSPAGSLVELQPLTGRMHQLRVQTALHGCPVRGDELYGAQRPFGPQAELPRDRIIALHARSLTFQHPIGYEAITVEAPLPDAWDELTIRDQQ